MSKDMLNIDDFMRERLGSHSEQEDPNAWLKMKALLDEEMPERAVPFYFRLRKPLMFVGAALLAGALCVGGYRMHAFKSGSGAPGGSAHTDKPQANRAANTINDSQNFTAPVSPTAATTEDNNQRAEEKTANRQSEIPTRPSSSHVTAKVEQVKPKTTNKVPTSAPIPLSSEKQAPDQVRVTEESNKALAHNTQTAVPQRLSAGVSDTRKPDNRPWTSAASTSDVSRAPVGNKKAAWKARHTESETPVKQTQNYPTNNPVAHTAGGEKHADSIKAIITVNKPTRADRNTRTVTYTTDTIAEQKVALQERTAAVATSEPAQNSLIEHLPAPNPADQKEAGKEGQRINRKQSKLEAKRQKAQFNGAAPKDLRTDIAATESQTTLNSSRKNAIARFVDNLRIEEKAVEAKRAIGNADHYFGFSVGGNYSLSSRADFRGVQFGPTAELVFNKHWSFFAALRYFNRSGANRSVNDNYVEDVSSNVPDSIRGANHYFTIFTDSTTRRFNFSTVQSLEMPLSVRYSFKNFYLMTGLNLVFTLPVNVELYQKNEGTQRSHVVATNSTSKPIIDNPGSSYDAASFKGRFGLGYIVGAGYRFAPAWHADFQLVNTFWDQATNKGATTVSKNFFRVPSVQISIGFQFNRGTKKPTFGPTDLNH